MPLKEIQQNFIRINGWNTFLKRTVVEAAAIDSSVAIKAEELFSCFGRRIEWVPDIAGIYHSESSSLIINEAFFALEEKVSTKEEIDTAMKLGTNYPFGPFEWGEKIGLQKYLYLARYTGRKAEPLPAISFIKTNSFGIIMAIILNIDTAVDTASVCLAREAKSLQFARVPIKTEDHASWLHLAVQKVITDAGLGLKDIEAIAVTTGPGSYTGLRVGLSAAKGLGFALNIPLITINTLEMMANAVKMKRLIFFALLLMPGEWKCLWPFMTKIWKQSLSPVP